MASTAPSSIQPASKGSAAAPAVNNDMELSAVGDARAPAPPPENDNIMQIARVGDVAAMEKLFESGEYDATYTDDEGITPLHVRLISLLPSKQGASPSCLALPSSSPCLPRLAITRQTKLV